MSQHRRQRYFPHFHTALVIWFLMIAINGRTQEAGQGADDAKRLQSISDYTARMKAANYPPLFDQAAKEFNVPPDVLKAVSFAETRWTQHEWPAGETVSPETGVPRSFGIMSLWDNDYFGHTLQQAAQLIGQTPEMLKTNVFQNMRGGAALLRQLYDTNPKPADAPDTNQIESWRYAIARYTGIPQPALSQGHALRVYEYMNLGYHEYGIEWDKHPVNLEPMRAEVAKLKEAGQLKKLATASESNVAAVPLLNTNPAIATNVPLAISNSDAPVSEDYSVRNQHQRWLLLSLMALLLLIAGAFLTRQKNAR